MNSTNSTQCVSTKSRFWRTLIAVCVVAGIITLAICWRSSSRPSEELFPVVVTANDRDYAREAFELRYKRKPDHLDTLSWLAEWYISKDRLADAIECFARIPTSHPQYGRMARFQQGRALLTLHRAADAEKQFRELISLEEVSPQIEPRFLIDARQRLRHILEVELRFEERKELLAGVVARGEADYFETLAYCFPSHLRWNGPDATRWLEEFYAVDPNDEKISVALGRYRTGQGKLDDARSLLEAAIQKNPNNLWALSALIACLYEADDPEELSRRVEALPPQSDNDPWLLLIHRGLYANQNGQPDRAIAAFEQLLKRDRTSTQGWAGLLPVISHLKDETRRKQVLRMAAGIGRIQNNLGKIIRRPKDPDTYLDVIDLCAEFGFDDEGWLIAEFVKRIDPQNPKVQSAWELFRSRLSAQDAKAPAK